MSYLTPRDKSMNPKYLNYLFLSFPALYLFQMYNLTFVSTKHFILIETFSNPVFTYFCYLHKRTYVSFLSSNGRRLDSAQVKVH